MDDEMARQANLQMMPTGTGDQDQDQRRKTEQQLRQPNTTRPGEEPEQHTVTEPTEAGSGSR